MDLPGYGTVKSRDRVEETDVDITEELTEFHGVEANWYAEGHEPEPVGDVETVPGLDLRLRRRAARSPYPTAVLGRELAWTDMRAERALHPPVSDGEVMVYAERDGGVSLRTTDTGELRWQVRLRGPILSAAGARRRRRGGGGQPQAGLGAVAWRTAGRCGCASLPDVVSASPAVAGDQVAVPTDDGSAHRARR